MMITQPVMVQKFKDEFDLPMDGQTPKTPAVPGSVLTGGAKVPERLRMPKKLQTKYRSGVGALLHMRWTRPDILNAVRELSRYMSGAMVSHMAAMKRVMRYVVETPNRGLKLKPNATWDGSKDFLFEVSGWSDSEYLKDDTRHSVNGWETYLNDAPVSFKSKMMPVIALSVAEAELYAAVQCAQDMLFIMRIMNSIGLKVRLPMKLHVDNKAAYDLCHNWKVGGRTRHVEVKQYFLRELKEAGIIEVVLVKGEDQRSDIHTKNVPQSLLEKHGVHLHGRDEYMAKVKFDINEKKTNEWKFAEKRRREESQEAIYGRRSVASEGEY